MTGLNLKQMNKTQKYNKKFCSNLLLRCVCKHPGDEDAVGDELQPGVHKARRFGGSQDVEGIAADQIRF